METPPTTLTYATFDKLELKADFYLPATHNVAPILVWFHSGGLTSGSRQSDNFPTWLRDATIDRGWVLVAADYRLILPSTGHDLLEDMKALSTFLLSPSLQSLLPTNSPRLDANRLVVGGDSAGGYLARLLVLQIGKPNCRAMYSSYGMGGNLLGDFWVQPHPNGVPSCGGPLNFSEVAHLITPEKPLEPISDNPHVMKPSSRLPFSSEGNRLSAFLYWLQTGELLDYVTGQKGLSAQLRQFPTIEERARALPENLKPLFPQLEPKSYPPTLLIHGENDDTVPVSDSEETYRALKDANIPTELVVADGLGHGFFALPIGLKVPQDGELTAKVISWCETWFADQV